MVSRIQIIRDLVIALVLGSVFFAGSMMRATQIPTVVFEGKYLDIWFESDCPRVYQAMTDRNADHSRAKVHPLFALIAFPPVYLIEHALGCDPVTAVRIVISLTGLCWIVAFYYLFRLMKLPVIDSTVLCLTAMVSAAGMFFFVIPETYPFASLTLLIALIIIVLAQFKKLNDIWFIGLNVLTLSVTTSNWMLGVLGTWFHRTKKASLMILGAAVVCVGVLWAVEKHFFPTTGNLLALAGERSFLNRPESVGPGHVIASIFYHTLIMPAFAINTDPAVPGWAGMITQPSLPGSATIWGKMAVGIWSLLIGLALYSLARLSDSPLKRVLIGFWIGQVGLHLVYGFETFLYSLHFIILLLVTASSACSGRFRPWTLGLLGILIPCLWLNNMAVYDQMLGFIHQHYAQEIHLKVVN